MKQEHQLLWLILPAAVGTYLFTSLVHYGFSANLSDQPFFILGSGRNPGFHDIKWLLSFSDCGGEVRELIRAGATCAGHKEPGYPILSMELARWLGWGREQGRWIGLLSGVGLTTVLAHACWLITANLRSWSILVSLIGLSYPYQLLLERGNLDSVIFLLMAAFCVLVWLPGIVPNLLANALSAFAIALKIYPAFGAVAWAIYVFINPTINQRERFVSLSLLIPITAVSLLWTSNTIVHQIPAASGALRSHGLLALGYVNSYLLQEFGSHHGRLWIYSLAALKILFLGIGLLGGLILCTDLTLPIPMRRRLNTALENRYLESLIVITTALGLGCYIVSISFDYRWVYLFPILGFLSSNFPRLPSWQPVKKYFFLSALGAALYILILPFHGLPNPHWSFFLEVADEMVLAPFLFGALGGIWLNLLGRRLQLAQIVAVAT